MPFNIEHKLLRVSQRNCPLCIERGSDLCFHLGLTFFYSTTACKFIGFFSLTIGLLLRVRILCIYTIFICEQSFLVPIHGIIISSHIKTTEQSNATNNEYRYILKLMIGSWLQGYHTGETTLKLSRHTKVVEILDVKRFVWCFVEVNYLDGDCLMIS